MFLRHPILSVLTLAYVALVAWLTLTPLSTGLESGLLWRVADLLAQSPATEWFTFRRLEFLANIALFVPFGIFLLLLFGRRRWWLAILLGVVMTVGIEFAQQFIPTRVPDTRDLVANSLGALIGAILGLALTASKARRIRVSGSARRATL
ncbi:MAG: VanZ family protein [Salinibacterium sp.]|nr:VanZ family protein [Salinibacterium sp.]